MTERPGRPDPPDLRAPGTRSASRAAMRPGARAGRRLAAGRRLTTQGDLGFGRPSRRGREEALIESSVTARVGAAAGPLIVTVLVGRGIPPWACSGRGTCSAHRAPAPPRRRRGSRRRPAVMARHSRARRVERRNEPHHPCRRRRSPARCHPSGAHPRSRTGPAARRASGRQSRWSRRPVRPTRPSRSSRSSRRRSRRSAGARPWSAPIARPRTSPRACTGSATGWPWHSRTTGSSRP